MSLVGSGDTLSEGPRQRASPVGASWTSFPGDDAPLCSYPRSTVKSASGTPRPGANTPPHGDAALQARSEGSTQQRHRPGPTPGLPRTPERNLHNAYDRGPSPPVVVLSTRIVPLSCQGMHSSVEACRRSRDPSRALARRSAPLALTARFLIRQAASKLPAWWTPAQPSL